MTGNVKKSTSDYRSRLLENISSKHPINNGIFMQVHHLISEKAINMSDIGSLLIMANYNINNLSNLVALPSTLPGACHLEVQLHRGDHRVNFSLENDDDADSNHPMSYHKFIVAKLNRLNTSLLKECGTDKKKLEKNTEEKMSGLSNYILKHIESFKIPLSDVGDSFISGGCGCKNTLTIAEHRNSEHSCNKPNRDHQGLLHSYTKKSKPETINFSKTKYQLKVGL